MLAKFVYILLGIVCYVAAFKNYAPSDVTIGLWLWKPNVLWATGILFAAFIIKRLVMIFYVNPSDNTMRRVILTVLFLPSYVFISLILVIDINGYFDNQSRVQVWNTNLLYYKDAIFACVTAGLDDAQIEAGQKKAEILFVPRTHCNNIDHTVNNSTMKHPYRITLSAGRLGIPYIVDLQAR